MTRMMIAAVDCNVMLLLMAPVVLRKTIAVNMNQTAALV